MLILNNFYFIIIAKLEAVENINKGKTCHVNEKKRRLQKWMEEKPGLSSRRGGDCSNGLRRNY
jgi:hypothetical protein